MTTNEQRSSLLQMAKGAIQERVDYEVTRVVDNLLDMNTEAKTKRKVVLTITMTTDVDRRVVKVEASAKSTLAPAMPVQVLPTLWELTNSQAIGKRVFKRIQWMLF